MILSGRDPRELAVDLLDRSICSVKCAAVLADAYGIHSWGWNSVGLGLGIHAEAHCLSRANPKRIAWSKLFVAAARARNYKTIIAKPCEECQELIENLGVKSVYFRDSDGEWRLLR